MAMEKLSRILGMNMLAIMEGVDCGVIREVIIDVDEKAVRYVVIESAKGCFNLNVLVTSKITGAGKDFITTNTSDAVSKIWETQEAMDLGYTDSDLIGARVVSNAGDVIGTIADFEFDVQEGTIKRYFMEDGSELTREGIVTLSKGIVFIAPESFVAATRSESHAPAAAPKAAAPKIEEPAAEEAAAEPVADEEKPQDDGSDMKYYFEKRRSKFLEGKTIKHDIMANDGSLLAAKGEVVTAEIIERIKGEDKLVELTMGVE